MLAIKPTGGGMHRQRASTFAGIALAVLLGLAGCAGGSAGDGDRIADAALRDALAGNTFVATITEKFSVGEIILIYYGADGVVKMKPQLGPPDEGVWEIEGGRICTRYRWLRNGMRTCSQVKRLVGDDMIISTVENRQFDGKLLKGNPHGL